MTDESPALRRLLFSIAYRMTGSAADADDIVQESYLRFQHVRREDVRDPRAFLTQVVTRLCIDRGRAMKGRRGIPPGVILPEPIGACEVVTPHDSVALAESLSIAFLVMIQRLAPVERAVFLLREVFARDYDEIARVVGRSEAACRQMTHRAKERLAEGRARFPASDEEVRAAVHRFAEIARNGEVEAMRRLLDPEVTLHTDGGDRRSTYGRARALSRPIHGADAVARFLIAVQAQAPNDMRYEIQEANGAPALFSYRAKRLVAIISFELKQGRIREIFLMVDPQKLTRAERVSGPN